MRVIEKVAYLQGLFRISRKGWGGGVFIFRKSARNKRIPPPLRVNIKFWYWFNFISLFIPLFSFFFSVSSLVFGKGGGAAALCYCTISHRWRNII